MEEAKILELKRQLFEWLREKKYKSINFNTYISFINSECTVPINIAEFLEAMNEFCNDGYFYINSNYRNPIYILTEKCIKEINSLNY